MGESRLYRSGAANTRQKYLHLASTHFLALGKARIQVLLARVEGSQKLLPTSPGCRTNPLAPVDPERTPPGWVYRFLLSS